MLWRGIWAVVDEMLLMCSHELCPPAWHRLAAASLACSVNGTRSLDNIFIFLQASVSMARLDKFLIFQLPCMNLLLLIVFFYRPSRSAVTSRELFSKIIIYSSYACCLGIYTHDLLEIRKKNKKSIAWWRDAVSPSIGHRVFRRRCAVRARAPFRPFARVSDFGK